MCVVKTQLKTQTGITTLNMKAYLPSYIFPKSSISNYSYKNIILSATTIHFDLDNWWIDKTN